MDVSEDPEAGGRGPEARHHEAVEAEAAAQGGGGGGGARHHDRHRVWAYFYTGVVLLLGPIACTCIAR